MYRFWAGNEPSRLTSGREPDVTISGYAGRPPAPLWRPSDPSFGDRPNGLGDAAVPDPDPGTPSSAPGVRASSSSVNRSGRSAEVVARGLRFLGMPVREAKMYLAFLDGPRSAREAAQIAGVHRATGYRVLLRLIDRGLVTSDDQNPRRFRAMDLSTLFHRLESFYREETEIPGCLAEAFEGRTEAPGNALSPFAALAESPRILAPNGKSTHPAILELSHAKRAVAAAVVPLSTPVGYRNALVRTLGDLARHGVHIRLLTDAMPADNRFCRAVLRWAGGKAAPIQVRHYSPVISQLYSIDRRTIVRIPTLGASSRAPPVGVAINDRARVQALVTRFESLWTEATGTLPNLGAGRETSRSPARDEDRLTASS